MTKPKTVKDFLADNDRETVIRTKIAAGINAMVKIGPEHHEGETEFAKLCGVQLVEVTKMRDAFKKHVAFVPKLLGRKARYIWFGNPKAVPDNFRYQPSGE